MFNKLNKLLILLYIIGLVESNGEKCSVIKDNDKRCGYTCYEALKPLLQYFATFKAKEQLYDEAILIIPELETTIKHMGNTIRDRENQLEVYKAKSVIADELLKLKNEKILELQSQLNKNIVAVPDTVVTAVENLETQLKDAMNRIVPTVKNIKVIKSSGYSQSSSDQIIIQETQANTNPNDLVKYLDFNCIGKSTDVYAFIGIEHLMIPCDSTLAGSGWTVIQRRLNGTENFHRNWNDYQRGFGDLFKEFFIGLEKLYLITNSQPYELYIHLADFDNEIRFARYSHFVVGHELESYAIKSLGEYDGNAGNAFKSHLNMQFSTPDRNFAEDVSCAEFYKSGWWFNEECYVCNLNGPYVTGNKENSNAIEWRSWHFKPLKAVQMMIRPTNI